MKKNTIILIALITFYFLFRFLLISLQRNLIFDHNEFFSGTVAMELIKGPLLPLRYYIPDDHNYGSIVNGILIVPFYLIFGPYSASAKMVSIMFSLGVLIFWYMLLKKYFNQRTAVITGLLFIFSPIIYTKSSVLSIGSHPESNLFTALMLLILYFILFDNKNRWPYFCILGLTSGFSLFYSYQCGITILILLVSLFIHDRKFMLKSGFYVFFVFFLIGFMPRIYFSDSIWQNLNVATEFINRAFEQDKKSLATIVIKTKAFLSRDLIRLFKFEKLPSLFQYLYFIYFIISFVILLVTGFKEKLDLKKAIFIIFFVFFSFIYIVSNYSIWKDWQNAGYIVPLYPFVFAITAIASDYLIAKKSYLKILSLIIVYTIIFSGFYENIALITSQEKSYGFRYKGYSYRFFGQKIGTQLSIYDRIDLLEKIDYPLKKYFLEGVGFEISSWGYHTKKGYISQRDGIEKLPVREEDKLYCYKGLGRALAQRIDFNLYCNPQESYNLEEDLNILKYISEEKSSLKKRFFWEGFGQGLWLSNAYRKIKEYIETEYKPYLYRGIGETASWFTLGEPDFSILEPEYRKYAVSGYSEASSEP